MGGNNKKAWATRRKKWGKSGASLEGVLAMSEAGKKARGDAKRRGDSEYYRSLAKKVAYKS